MAPPEVDPTSNVPVFEQIVDSLRYAIASGRYAPGEQLPSVRQLAIALLVNPNTVARAYRELEREGLTRTRRGLGIFVSEAAPEACRRARRDQVARRIAAAFDGAIRSGLEPGEIQAIVQEQLRNALEGVAHAAAPSGTASEE